MLLDRLFEMLSVRVSPFGLYRIGDEEPLRLEPQASVSLHFVLDGSGSFHGSTGPALALGPHTLVLVPPRTRHAIKRSPGSRQDSLTIACGRIDVRYGEHLGLFDHLRTPLALDFAGSPHMQSTFAGLLDETRRGRQASRAMMAALMNQCLVLVFRELCDEPECPLPWLTALDDPRLGAALDLMLGRPDLPHSVDSLAERAGMSRSAFARDFALRFGTPPMAFLREVRLQRAAHLITATSLGVDAVAVQVGFASRSHFSRAFAVRFGHAPARFRIGGTGTASGRRVRPRQAGAEGWSGVVIGA